MGGSPPPTGVGHAVRVEVLTAEQSERDQRAVAGALLARGLRPGDRAALVTTSGGPMLSAILGALSLYLNFVNLFTLLLQLFGQRQD